MSLAGQHWHCPATPWPNSVPGHQSLLSTNTTSREELTVFAHSMPRELLPAIGQALPPGPARWLSMAEPSLLSKLNPTGLPDSDSKVSVGLGQLERSLPSLELPYGTQCPAVHAQSPLWTPRLLATAWCYQEDNCAAQVLIKFSIIWEEVEQAEASLTPSST